MKKQERGKQKGTVTLIAAILAVSLAACGEEQSASTSLGSDAGTQQEAAAAQPEPTTAEPVEAVTEEIAVEEPAEEVVEEPVEEEPVVDNASLINELNESQDPIYVTMSSWNIDTMKIIIWDQEEFKAIEILDDGDSFEFSGDGYTGYLYVPQKVSSVLNEEGGELYQADSREYNGVAYDGLYFLSLYGKDDINQSPVTKFTVTYEDGTTESMTLHFAMR